jgi:hypothetical protein
MIGINENAMMVNRAFLPGESCVNSKKIPTAGARTRNLAGMAKGQPISYAGQAVIAS